MDENRGKILVIVALLLGVRVLVAQLLELQMACFSTLHMHATTLQAVHFKSETNLKAEHREEFGDIQGIRNSLTVAFGCI